MRRSVLAMRAIRAACQLYVAHNGIMSKPDDICGCQGCEDIRLRLRASAGQRGEDDGWTVEVATGRFLTISRPGAQLVTQLFASEDELQEVAADLRSRLTERDARTGDGDGWRFGLADRLDEYSERIACLASTALDIDRVADIRQAAHTIRWYARKDAAARVPTDQGSPRGQEQVGEPVWLVERTDAGRPEWLTWSGWWDKDANKAGHFDRAGAEWRAKSLGAVATEHIFLRPPAPEPEGAPRAVEDE